MMKFESIKMKSLVPYMAALAISFSLAANAPRAFARGDGRGISGPDLSGDALPIAVDRQVTTKEADKVTRKCAAEMARGLLSQLYRADESSPYKFLVEFDSTSIAAGTHFNDFYYQYFRLTEYSSETRLNVLPQDMAPAKPYYHFNVVDLVAPAIGIPALVYETFNADYVYDELGREVRHKTYVKNLRLKASKQVPIRFKNVQTGVETGITLDLRPYAECLVDEVQSGEFAK